ncbi:hypothetical protein ACIBP6_45175 [Nonomuraea terrae]|uniref:hypothetical protein n=1 Tax=Nonomuraea terrae TaxID=2530383 RepID=UPI0037AA4B68
MVRYSPIIPTIASFLLAALWALSVFAGWGLQAFCVDGQPACAQRLGAVTGVSGLFAAVAAVCTAGAWLMPFSRRDQRAFTRVMGAGMLAWIAAEGVLFVGGLLVR